MTKAELVSRIADKSDVTKKAAEAVVKSVTDAIYEALRDVVKQ